MRVVIDTNVLLQAVPRTGRYAAILDAFAEGAFSWVITAEIHLEYLELLDKRGSRNARYFWENIITYLPDFIIPTLYYRFDIISADLDDNKFVDAYVASVADYLVTEDRHFNVLKNVGFPKVNLISPVAFISILQSK